MANTNQQKDADRWIGGTLWTEMRLGREWWDRPLNPPRRPSNKVAVKCGRCDGKGAIASFSVRYSGVCFACGGSGFRLISKAAYEKRKALRKALPPAPQES